MILELSFVKSLAHFLTLTFFGINVPLSGYQDAPPAHPPAAD
jgi:hypothetical protein